jgi:hypothetical protein
VTSDNRTDHAICLNVTGALTASSVPMTQLLLPEPYNGTKAGNRNMFSPAVKFSIPTLINGTV